MIRTEKTDSFFDKQPSVDFTTLLGSPVHTEKMPGFGKREQDAAAVDVSGMYLDVAFPDPEGLLETAYADFNRFLSVYEMAGKRYPLRVVCGETRCFEAYTVTVDATGITLLAADTEGIRRGLIYIEDTLCINEGPYLMPGETERYPHVRDRISRCFFSPTNRPPKNGDELSDDIDYYPEEYLNRLAHDGTNGVWIYTSFNALLPTGMIEEYGEGSEKRLEKLRGVIRRCARYGVRVFIFAIEPFAFTTEEMREKYPQVLGANLDEVRRCFCTNTEFGRAYCIDSTETMAKLLPGLGGFISITNGERLTNCAAVPTEQNNCPHCHGKGRGEILSQTVDSLQEGFRRSGSDARFVSWTYGHGRWDAADIEEYVRTAPSDVALMQNFEDTGIVEQLGKKRLAADYWLSYAGPSNMFEVTAKAAQKYGKIMYAKLQVCCSHEVATVPYIPSPGLVFEKLKGCHMYGVSGIMECWYFGNYPSLMSKAAGELSFVHDFSDKKAFLKRLAAIYWGRSRAEEVAKAWQFFEDAYTQYPVNIMFSYYGPMHDGITWELQPEPKNFSLPRSWYSTDKPDGDRIEECLMTGHTLEEAVTLTGEMCRLWKKGMDTLEGVSADDIYLHREQLSVARALSILFESGHNILRFYKLRDSLGRGIGDGHRLVAEMEEIVRREIALTKAMIPLCEADIRLGYHSEAENFKFFPEKLEYRIGTLEKLFDTEFAAIRSRLESGEAPLPYYLGQEEGIPSYKMGQGRPENANWEPLHDGTSRFRASYTDTQLFFEIESTDRQEILLAPEFQILKIAPPMRLFPDGTKQHAYSTYIFYMGCLEGRMEKIADLWQVERLPGEGTHLLVTFDRSQIGWEENTPMKMQITGRKAYFPESLWVQEENPICTLGKGETSPGQFGWLIP